jgi:hypothetical protein
MVHIHACKFHYRRPRYLATQSIVNILFHAFDASNDHYEPPLLWTVTKTVTVNMQNTAEHNTCS